jgi:hypothetical protein
MLQQHESIVAKGGLFEIDTLMIDDWRTGIVDWHPKPSQVPFSQIQFNQILKLNFEHEIMGDRK